MLELLCPAPVGETSGARGVLPQAHDFKEHFGKEEAGE